MSTNIGDHKLFTQIAAILLALIAIGHVLRVVYAVELVVGGMVIPVGASVPVVVVMAGVAWMAWRESKTP